MTVRTFPSVGFDPKEPGVDKVEIEGADGKELRGTVHLSSVASIYDGREIAYEVSKKALDRITFNHGTPIETSRLTGEHFLPILPQPGVAHASGAAVALAVGNALVDATTLKRELEQPSPPGERYYGLFRAARQSASPVEEFMHLYNLLLMFFNDVQDDVDEFIVGQDSTVPQSPKPARPKRPKKPKRDKETVYTHLRNEFAHKRVGVDLQKTKVEMAAQLGGLRTLAKRAIELKG